MYTVKVYKTNSALFCSNGATIPNHHALLVSFVLNLKNKQIGLLRISCVDDLFLDCPIDAYVA